MDRRKIHLILKKNYLEQIETILPPALIKNQMRQTHNLRLQTNKHL
jgi:hypothetical protein